MPTLTPHRDALEKVLAEGARQMAARPAPLHAAEALERHLSFEMASLVVRSQADAADQGISNDLIFGVVGFAFGNAVASAAASMVEGDRTAAARVLSFILGFAQDHGLRTLSGPADIDLRGDVETSHAAGRA